jgi:hypothetical protein
LSQPAPGCQTAITAIYSDLDQVVLPTASGRCDHPDLVTRNLLVRGVGHLSLPVHPAVVNRVTAALRGHPSVTARQAGPAAAGLPTRPFTELATRRGGAAADAA